MDFDSQYDPSLSSYSATGPIQSKYPNSGMHDRSQVHKQSQVLPDNVNTNNSCKNMDNIDIQTFLPQSNKALSLNNYAYISKDCTQRLSDHIVSENWGKNNGLLYKYLDYIYRCQVFDKEAVLITQNNQNEYLLFHSGLQRKKDLEFLYVIFVPNKREYQRKQEWRIHGMNMNHSFVSATELVERFGPLFGAKNNYSYFCEFVPRQTKFYDGQVLSELLFDEEYKIEHIDWRQRIVINKDRIYPLSLHDLDALAIAFDKALKMTLKLAALNPRIAVPQGFIDTKHQKYRRELLLPLNVEYPDGSNKIHKFALAVSKSNVYHRNNNYQCFVGNNNDRKVYIVKSLLKINMAYANARLVGRVDSSWLKLE